MPVTLKKLFHRIADGGHELTKDKLEAFVKDAGVSNSFLMPKASLAAGAFMDKFDDGSGCVFWDRFRTRGLALVPPGILDSVDTHKIAHELDATWHELDPHGTGAVDVKELTSFIEAKLSARGQSFAGTKADAGARVLLHALDDNGDHLLQKDELKGFLLDVAHEAGV